MTVLTAAAKGRHVMTRGTDQFPVSRVLAMCYLKFMRLDVNFCPLMTLKMNNEDQFF
jgi:hypothetical protein